MVSFLTQSLNHVIAANALYTDHAALIFFTLLTLCYLIGGIPTSYLLAKYLKGVDIRSYGSGNSGATNAARLLGKPFFGLIILLDAGKAYSAVALCARLLPELSEVGLLMCAAAVLVGNAFSPFIGFRGGKAGASGLGLLLYFLPFFAVGVYAGVFVGMLTLFRRVDIATLSAALGGALYVVFFGATSVAIAHAALVCALWVWMRHWKNILHLLGFLTLG